MKSRAAQLLERHLFLVVLGVLFLFRIAIVLSWHAPAGDGLQYYKLAEELRRAHRFSFGPAAGLSYARLPGYPLFLAAISLGRELSLSAHVILATLANVVLDFGTAWLVFLILRDQCQWKIRRLAQIGLLAVLLLPSFWLMSCFALTESLSTFLGTLEIYFALRAFRGNPMRAAALAGMAAGLGQLVRVDAIAFLPGVVLALFWLPTSRRQRVTALGAFVVTTLIVFSPWPIRNTIQFGRPHFGAATWRTMNGKPLPTGMVNWARTWASSTPGEGFFELFVANDWPLDVRRPGIVIPSMYDSAVERQRVVDLMQRYNRVRFDPEVDAGFEQLARERLRRGPLRVLCVLPAKRIFRLFTPEPEWEMPMRVSWLGLPRLRFLFGLFDGAVVILALVGGYVLFRRRAFRLLAVVTSCLAARMAVYAIAIPWGTTHRYFFETLPLLILLAVIGGEALVRSRKLPAGERAVHQLQAVLPPE